MSMLVFRVILMLHPFTKLPWRFSGADYVPPSGPAWQGEHNEEILREAGVSQATIDELKDKGILVARYEDRWT